MSVTGEEPTCGCIGLHEACASFSSQGPCSARTALQCEWACTHLEGDIRLMGGKFPHEGVVEIYFGQWLRVCNKLFTEVEAEVVCKQLGYSGGLMTYHLYSPFEYTESPFWTEDVECIGNETHIDSCVHTPPPDYVECDGEFAYATPAVVCEPSRSMQDFDSTIYCSSFVDGQIRKMPVLPGTYGSDEVFLFHLDTASEVVFSPCQSDIDTRLTVYTLDFQPTDCYSNYCGCTNLDCGVDEGQWPNDEICLLPAGSYMFVVDGYQGAHGYYKFDVQCKPVSGFLGEFSCHSSMSGKLLLEPNLIGTSEPDGWAIFLMERNGIVTFDPCDGSIDQFKLYFNIFGVDKEVDGCSYEEADCNADEEGEPEPNFLNAMTCNLEAGAYVFAMEGLIDESYYRVNPTCYPTE